MTVAPIKSSRPKFEQMADESNEALHLFINRSAGQHGRRMKEGWETVERIEITTRPADLDPPGTRGSVEFVDPEPGWFRRVLKSIFN